MGKDRETKRKTEPQEGKVDALKKRELTDEEKARLETYREWARRTKPLKFKAARRRQASRQCHGR